MQTTKDPLVELLQHIDCKLDEARGEQRNHAAYGGHIYATACGKVSALAELRKTVASSIGEAADVDRPSPVVRSGAWMGGDEALRAEARLAKAKWQAEHKNGEELSRMMSANEIWTAAYAAGHRAHEGKPPIHSLDDTQK